MTGGISGEGVFRVLKATKVHILVAKVYHKIHYNNPTDDMLKARAYFKANKERVDRITNMLVDKKSKDVYSKMIQFRQYSNAKEFPEFCEHDQYFASDIIKLKDNEVFVDCGAFTGDTVRSFLKYSKGKYKKIICLEPDTQNAKELVKFTESNNLKETNVIKSGAWSKKDILKFNNGNSSCSSIGEDDENTIQIDVIDLDSVEECQEATFIKMDIEGAELPALEGAKNIIQRNKPTLTICIYHSDEDMIRIPEYIKTLVPEYEFYVRQHLFHKFETVLYAVIEE